MPWEVTLSWQPLLLLADFSLLDPTEGFSFLGKKEILPPAALRYQRCRNGPGEKHIWGLGSVSLPKFKLLTLFPEALGLFKQATVISFL